MNYDGRPKKFHFLTRISNFILRIACFIVGRRFEFLVRNCSMHSVKRTMSYFSGMMIIVIIWAVVSFTFSKEYMKFSTWASLAVAVVAVFVVISIERIIISSERSVWATISRFVLGLLMAFIGSLVIDQYLFKDDIAKAKKDIDAEEVEIRFQEQTKVLNNRIASIDSAINQTKSEISALREKLSKEPVIFAPEYEENKRFAVIDGRDTTVTDRIIRNKSIINPITEEIKSKESLLNTFINEKKQKEDKKINLYAEVQKEVDSRKGLITELQALFSVVFKNTVAKVVYAVFFLFFLFLELMITLLKFLQKEDDYDMALRKQHFTFQEHFHKLYPHEADIKH